MFFLKTECPYECIITDVGSVRARGDALTRAQRGKTARFEVSLNDTERGELDVVVSGIFTLFRGDFSLFDKR